MPLGPTKVMIFGTFDILHAGHEHVFEQARRLGDQLIVVVARDETVQKLKGCAPYNNDRTRVKNLKLTGLVDKVVQGNIHDKYEIIRTERPDVIALGYDQYAFTYGLQKFLIEQKLNTAIHRLTPYKPHIYKSSMLRIELFASQSSLQSPLAASSLSAS